MAETIPCDLHVLSMPPAFALSQDQTLRFIIQTLPSILRTKTHKPTKPKPAQKPTNKACQSTHSCEIRQQTSQIQEQSTKSQPMASTGHKTRNKPQTKTTAQTPIPIQPSTGQTKGRRQLIPSSTDLLVNEHPLFRGTKRQRRSVRRVSSGMAGSCQRDDMQIPQPSRAPAMRNAGLVSARHRFARNCSMTRLHPAPCSKSTT